jgi:hypothetical protein
MEDFLSRRKMMTEPFCPTATELEALAEFWGERRIQIRLHQVTTGWSGPTDEVAIQETEDRLDEIALVIGEEDVQRILDKVESEFCEVVGEDTWRIVTSGTQEEQDALAERWDRRGEKEPSPSVLIHNVFGDEEGHWLHTHGLEEMGLPELEIRNVPSYFVDAAANHLRQVSQYMQEPDVFVKLGETVQVGPNSVARLVQAEPLPGNEDHYESERWVFRPVSMICSECGSDFGCEHQKKIDKGELNNAR